MDTNVTLYRVRRPDGSIAFVSMDPPHDRTLIEMSYTIEPVTYAPVVEETALDRHIKEMKDSASDFLIRSGYTFCDIPACNCGSWHGGHARERLSEVRELLEEHGVQVNGKTILDAVASLFDPERENVVRKMREALVEAASVIAWHVGGCLCGKESSGGCVYCVVTDALAAAERLGIGGVK